jgi:hypothetical protein
MITSDDRQYILRELYVDKDGEENWKPKHYFGKLETLLSHYLDLRVRKSDSKTMKELIEEVKGIRKEITQAIESIGAS